MIDRQAAIAFGGAIGFGILIIIQSLVPKPIWYQILYIIPVIFFAVKTAEALHIRFHKPKKKNLNQREK